MTTEPDREGGARERDLQVAYWPLGRLVPFANNARTHREAQVAEIAASIRAFGFTNPILVGEDGDIIAGHGRLAAARQLGFEQVPVIVLKGLSPAERRQLVLADNRIALNAGWDQEMLKLELQDLKALGADLACLGFTKVDLAKALTPESCGLVDEDEVPEVEERAITQAGDLWQLGPHRLLCGDATDEAGVAELLAGATPQLMVTDPPYGVSYDPSWRHRLGVSVSKRKRPIANDDAADWSTAWALFPGSIAYVWHGALHAATVAASLESQGFALRAQIIWAKERLVIGRGDYHWQHEPCWYGVREKGNWVGDRKQTTLWTISSRAQDTETSHATQKPVECMRRPILNNSSPGDAVYDPFLGSGTTLIAAESTGRSCLALELDPCHVDVAVRRWQAFTGRKASRSDGPSFDELAVAAATATKPARPTRGTRSAIKAPSTSGAAPNHEEHP